MQPAWAFKLCIPGDACRPAKGFCHICTGKTATSKSQVSSYSRSRAGGSNGRRRWPASNAEGAKNEATPTDRFDLCTHNRDGLSTYTTRHLHRSTHMHAHSSCGVQTSTHTRARKFVRFTFQTAQAEPTPHSTHPARTRSSPQPWTSPRSSPQPLPTPRPPPGISACGGTPRWRRCPPRGPGRRRRWRQ